jgi:hypothetical protein
MRDSKNNPKSAGYLAKNRHLNLVTAGVGLGWAGLEYVSGSIFWVVCALVLVAFSLFNLFATKPKQADL